MRLAVAPSALFAAVFALFAAAPAYADRMALWTIVHEQCVPHLRAGEGPKPCESVDLAQGEDNGVALLKDRNGVAQYLAIPTRRVTGIEDPQLLAPDAPDYFAFAWAARRAVEARLDHPLPREAVGVAVNSAFARSQDQLHLHVDCMDKEVVAALASYQDALDDRWRVMTVALKGRHYWARRLDWPIFPTSRRSACSPTGSKAPRTIWVWKRWSRSARISPASPASSFWPITRNWRPAATAKICRITIAKSQWPRRDAEAGQSTAVAKCRLSNGCDRPSLCVRCVGSRSMNPIGVKGRAVAGA